MTRQQKRFFRKMKIALIRFAIFFTLISVAVFATLFILSLPEIIGLLIFG